MYLVGYWWLVKEKAESSHLSGSVKKRFSNSHLTRWGTDEVHLHHRGRSEEELEGSFRRTVGADRRIVREVSE